MSSAFNELLRPGKIGPIEVASRIIMGPMERGMANRDGSLTQGYVDYLGERARGEASLIIIESSYVDVRGMGHLYQVGCHADHVIPGLRRAANSVHAARGKLGIELYFGGRQTPSYMSQRQPLAPSAVECAVLQPTPTPREMTVEEIKTMVAAFARAAERAVEAGLDLIHLHGAHGYLLGSFLSPFSNRRSDEYGGELTGRSRFGLEVVAAVRAAVGQNVAVGYRLSAEEYVEGGLTIEETSKFAKLLADAGVDLIDVSGGIYESASMIVQGPEAPPGGFVRNARAIKTAVGDSVAVSVAQRLNDPVFADGVLRREGLDFITLSRAFHADPAYVAKLRSGRPEQILPCIACHHCTNLLEANRPARCAANPNTGFERQRRVREARQARSILIVGGGVAGLQAARLLALQGHRVRLHEAASALGGQMRFSARVAPDYGRLISFLEQDMHRLKVDVHLDAPISAEHPAIADADAVVIATGARGGLRFFETQGSPRVLDLFDALDAPIGEWMERVVIAGGDSESCFLALYLAGRGAEVHIIEPSGEFSADKMSPGKNLLLDMLAAFPTVSLHPETTVEAIGDNAVHLQHRGGFKVITDTTAVVVGGRVADNELADHLRARGDDTTLFTIGDCVEPRDVYHATHEAAQVADLLGV